MADLVFAIILFYAFILGARRGFYKEVVQTAALIIAVLVARAAREPVGASIRAGTGDRLPLMIAEVFGVIVVWIAAFLVAGIVGKLLLKKIRGKGIDDNLDEGAEAIADLIGGDTTKGPVTLLTDPIASRRGLFYWSDKILGSGLGLLKGLITAYLLFVIVIYTDRARGWDSTVARSIEESWATRAYKEYIERYLVTFPEYRIVASLGDMKKIAEAVQATKDPRQFQSFVTDKRLRALRENKKILELAKDKELIQAWKDQDLGALLQNPKVRDLLSDPEVRKIMADIDWRQVRRDVENWQGGKQPAKTAEPSESAKTAEPEPLGEAKTDAKTGDGDLPELDDPDPEAKTP